MIPADPHAPEAQADEVRWVDAELITMLMRSAAGSHWAMALVIPVVATVLWDDAPRHWLVAWLAATGALIVARSWAVARFARVLATGQPHQRLEFFSRVRHLWTASALLWGLMVAMFLDSAPLSDQFLCWLVLTGVAMFAINSLSPHRATARAFANAMCLSALGAVAWQAVVVNEFDGPYYHVWLLALLVIFWQMLHHVARRQHAVQRRGLELQFRNAQLIDSLTRQTQAALEAVEVKNRFLASATHDIRQPVHALALYADWLAGEPELAGEIAPKIVESTKAVNALFDSLFDLVRLDSGKMRLHLEEVDLDRLLAELEVQYRPLATSKGLRLRVRHRKGLGRVMTDALLLKRIVGNLISNAVKYTERGGVLVAVRRRAGVPHIEVWDTGVGIAPVHQRDIFREFYTVPMHAGTQEGFGLGLHIVSRLSHLLGHAVTLQSRPGKGTVFRVVLTPADPAQAGQRAATYAQLARSP